MKKNAFLILLVSGLFFALSGCRGDQGSTEVAAPVKPVAERDAPRLMVGEAANTNVVDLSSQVKIAVTDLAGRLDIPSDAIQVIRAESVTWRDASQGCPKKDMSYSQALVPGILIVLRADNVDYEYHGGGSRDVFYCANPKLPAPAPAAE